MEFWFALAVFLGCWVGMMVTKRDNPATIAFAVFAICVTGTLMFTVATGNTFSRAFGWWPAPGTPSYDPGPWCERERTQDFLREPANASSDFAYLALSLYILTCAARDFQRQRADAARTRHTSFT